VRLTAFPMTDLQDKIMLMGRLAREMLKDSLDALIALDVRKAAAVIARDDEVDRLNVEIINGVIARAMPGNTGATIESLILIHSVARDLERIGDHATNIAEDVAYLVDGTIIRHRHTEQS
jgi:phosphate transport system protein